MGYAPALRPTLEDETDAEVAGTEVGRRHRVLNPGMRATYHMLKDGTFYQDLDPAHFERRRPEAQARRLVKRLAALGFSVQPNPLRPSHDRSVSL
jgi:hypothetical protein